MKGSYDCECERGKSNKLEHNSSVSHRMANPIAIWQQFLNCHHKQPVKIKRKHGHPK